MLSSPLAIAILALGTFHQTYAQSTSPLCSNSTVLIKSLSTLNAAQECTSVAGDIVIEYGSDLPSQIDFPKLRQVGGSFLSISFDEDIRAQQLSAPNLTVIVGDFYISRWDNLTTIDMPMLKKANRVRLNNLPALKSANFLSTISSIDNNYEIRNTSLTEITNSRLTTAVFVQIFDNPRLKKVELSALRNASYNVALKRNLPGLQVSLPELREVWYFDVNQIGSLALPRLETAIGHFIINSSSLERLEAPALKNVGTWFDPKIIITENKGLVIVNSPNLSNISLPSLESVQLDLYIRNNPALKQIDFPSLKDVTGNVVIEGSPKTVTIAHLERVGGVFSLGTDVAPFNCEPFSQLKNKGGIRKDYSCPTFKDPPVRKSGLAAKNTSQAEITEWLHWQHGSGADNLKPIPLATVFFSFGAALLLQAF
ncbi:hypothetical protein DRE_06708 [Drechslerella stenobrocha 248]|uniref:Receptor L-domain domain-containing protein n=1 Tax=Drechslerella stenobrocha 248 TaxID=1043628 RepID=W7HKL6_9PEZI|nr:hypothetical protein DRE_06708 [Drechslerella stenobrocha 248]